MKVIKFANLLVLGVVVTLVVVGCKRNPYGITPLRDKKPGALAGPGPGGMIDTRPPTEFTEGEGIPHGPGHPGWPKDHEFFKANTVFFDFDSSTIKSSEKAKIDTVADHLRANPSHAVEIEGHCDERGTEEYNRALGERRALAVREYLVRGGIDPTRVDTISFGEDRPVDTGQSEEAWRKNRRGEFVQLTPPK